MNANTAEEAFSCHKIAPGKVEGLLLTSTDDICFYLADPNTGKIIEDGHVLEGVSVANAILSMPSGKGSSVVQADGLYQLAMQGNAPRAIIVQNPDTVLVASCIILEIPLVDRVPGDFYQTAQSGDVVGIDTDRNVLTLKAGGSVDAH